MPSMPASSAPARVSIIGLDDHEITIQAPSSVTVGVIREAVTRSVGLPSHLVGIGDSELV